MRKIRSTCLRPGIGPSLDALSYEEAESETTLVEVEVDLGIPELTSSGFIGDSYSLYISKHDKPEIVYYNQGDKSTEGSVKDAEVGVGRSRKDSGDADSTDRLDIYPNVEEVIDIYKSNKPPEEFKDVVEIYNREQSGEFDLYPKSNESTDYSNLEFTSLSCEREKKDVPKLQDVITLYSRSLFESSGDDEQAMSSSGKEDAASSASGVSREYAEDVVMKEPEKIEDLNEYFKRSKKTYEQLLLNPAKFDYSRKLMLKEEKLAEERRLKREREMKRKEVINGVKSKEAEERKSPQSKEIEEIIDVDMEDEKPQDEETTERAEKEEEKDKESEDSDERNEHTKRDDSDSTGSDGGGDQSGGPGFRVLDVEYLKERAQHEKEGSNKHNNERSENGASDGAKERSDGTETVEEPVEEAVEDTTAKETECGTEKPCKGFEENKAQESTENIGEQSFKMVSKEFVVDTPNECSSTRDTTARDVPKEYKREVDMVRNKVAGDGYVTYPGNQEEDENIMTVLKNNYKLYNNKQFINDYNSKYFVQNYCMQFNPLTVMHENAQRGSKSGSQNSGDGDDGDHTENKTMPMKDEELYLVDNKMYNELLKSKKKVSQYSTNKAANEPTEGEIYPVYKDQLLTLLENNYLKTLNLSNGSRKSDDSSMTDVMRRGSTGESMEEVKGLNGGGRLPEGTVDLKDIVLFNECISSQNSSGAQSMAGSNKLNLSGIHSGLPSLSVSGSSSRITSGLQSLVGMGPLRRASLSFNGTRSGLPSLSGSLSISGLNSLTGSHDRNHVGSSKGSDNTPLGNSMLSNARRRMSDSSSKSGKWSNDMTEAERVVRDRELLAFIKELDETTNTTSSIESHFYSNTLLMMSSNESQDNPIDGGKGVKKKRDDVYKDILMGDFKSFYYSENQHESKDAKDDEFKVDDLNPVIESIPELAEPNLSQVEKFKHQKVDNEQGDALENYVKGLEKRRKEQKKVNNNLFKRKYNNDQFKLKKIYKHNTMSTNRLTFLNTPNTFSSMSSSNNMNSSSNLMNSTNSNLNISVNAVNSEKALNAPAKEEDEEEMMMNMSTPKNKKGNNVNIKCLELIKSNSDKLIKTINYTLGNKKTKSHVPGIDKDNNKRNILLNPIKYSVSKLYEGRQKRAREGEEEREKKRRNIYDNWVSEMWNEHINVITCKKMKLGYGSFSTVSLAILRIIYPYNRQTPTASTAPTPASNVNVADNSPNASDFSSANVCPNPEDKDRKLLYECAIKNINDNYGDMSRYQYVREKEMMLHYNQNVLKPISYRIMYAANNNSRMYQLLLPRAKGDLLTMLNKLIIHRTSQIYNQLASMEGPPRSPAAKRPKTETTNNPSSDSNQAETEENKDKKDDRRLYGLFTVEIKYLLIQILNGLSFIHMCFQGDILRHTDIKLTNVLVFCEEEDRFNPLKWHLNLADFGCALLITPNQYFKQIQHLYMSLSTSTHGFGGSKTMFGKEFGGLGGMDKSVKLDENRKDYFKDWYDHLHQQMLSYNIGTLRYNSPESLSYDQYLNKRVNNNPQLMPLLYQDICGNSSSLEEPTMNTSTTQPRPNNTPLKSPDNTCLNKSPSLLKPNRLQNPSSTDVSPTNATDNSANLNPTASVQRLVYPTPNPSPVNPAPLNNPINPLVEPTNNLQRTWSEGTESSGKGNQKVEKDVIIDGIKYVRVDMKSDMWSLGIILSELIKYSINYDSRGEIFDDYLKHLGQTQGFGGMKSPSSNKSRDDREKGADKAMRERSIKNKLSNSLGNGVFYNKLYYHLNKNKLKKKVVKRAFNSYYLYRDREREREPRDKDEIDKENKLLSLYINNVCNNKFEVRKKKLVELYRKNELNEVDEQLLNLLTNLLSYEPEERMMSIEALGHPCFDNSEHIFQLIDENNAVFVKKYHQLYKLNEQNLSGGLKEKRVGSHHSPYEFHEDYDIDSYSWYKGPLYYLLHCVPEFETGSDGKSSAPGSKNVSRECTPKNSALLRIRNVLTPSMLNSNKSNYSLASETPMNSSNLSGSISPEILLGRTHTGSTEDTPQSLYDDGKSYTKDISPNSLSEGNYSSARNLDSMDSYGDSSEAVSGGSGRSNLVRGELGSGQPCDDESPQKKKLGIDRNKWEIYKLEFDVLARKESELYTPNLIFKLLFDIQAKHNLNYRQLTSTHASYLLAQELLKRNQTKLE